MRRRRGFRDGAPTPAATAPAPAPKPAAPAPAATAGHRRGLRDAVLRVGGYPTQNGTRLTDGQGKVIGIGRKIGCTRVRPGERGAWISNERCSYQFKIRGLWYGCRGRGDGMAASCRVMKRLPRDVPSRNTSKYFDVPFEGTRRRRRR